MEIKRVTDDLFNAVSIFLFSNAVWLFYFSLEIFISNPQNWIIHKNYAIYDFHPLFFRDINTALEIRWQKNITPKIN